MIVHCCDRCCVYKKEIQPCRIKYRGIWAILMNKMMFPFQRCNSVSKCSFREFRPFSVIAENHWPSVCICACIFVCFPTCVGLCVYLPLSLCVCVCVCVCVCACVWGVGGCSCTCRGPAVPAPTKEMTAAGADTRAGWS